MDEQTPSGSASQQEQGSQQPPPDGAPAAGSTPATGTQAAPKKKGGWGKWVALGCGCLTLLTIAVVVVLVVVLLPILQRAGSATKDVAAISKLRNGATAAAAYAAENNGSFEGLDAAKLAGNESAVGDHGGRRCLRRQDVPRQGVVLPGGQVGV